MRGIIWGFIGILFGSLFVILLNLSKSISGPIPPLIIAGTLSAGVGALIYGSMRLAVLVAAFCAPLSVMILVASHQATNPFFMVVATGSLGAVVGAFYGAFARSSRVYRADAKALAGLTAGLLVSGGYAVMTLLLGISLPISLQVALLCPLTGLLYTWLVVPFIPRFENLLPPIGDGALAGFGAALFIGFSMWLVAGHIDIQVTAGYTATVDAILLQLPGAAIGGMLGAFLGGFVGGLAGMGWQDL